MSELIEKSVELIEKSSRGVLLTLDEKSEIHGRPIGAFGNDGVNLIFATRKATKKVTHIKIHPKVTFYIENTGTSFGEFKYLSVTGNAEALTDKTELDNAIKAISIKYPKIITVADSEDFEEWQIYKITATSVKLYENTEAGPIEVSEIIGKR